MSESPEWKWQAIVGAVLVAQSLLDWGAPAGPWNSSSFTSGVIALVGGGLLYVAWFRAQFDVKGIIPYLRLWDRPPMDIVVRVGIAGVIAVVGARLLGIYGQNVPAPFSMIIMLVGLLALLYALYAWLVLLGPLTISSSEDD